jgi:hypothetical protein
MAQSREAADHTAIDPRLFAFNQPQTHEAAEHGFQIEVDPKLVDGRCPYWELDSHDTGHPLLTEQRELCPYKNGRFDLLLTHFRTQHGKSFCSWCLKLFHTENERIQHMHVDYRESSHCKPCFEAFESQSIRDRHKKTTSCNKDNYDQNRYTRFCEIVTSIYAETRASLSELSANSEVSGMSLKPLISK